MALPQNSPNNEVIVSSRLADVSAASTCYAAAVARGKLVRSYSVIDAALTTTDCTWTMQVNGVAVTGTATITQSGSAAGDVDELVISSPVEVNRGDTIAWISGGESDTTAVANFYAVIRT